MPDKQIDTKRAGQPDVFPTERASVHIAIDTRGNINLETVGTTGNQCDTVFGALEDNLGIVIDRTNKETYRKQGESSEWQRRKTGED